jgi:hypothetical protein
VRSRNTEVWACPVIFSTERSHAGYTNDKGQLAEQLARDVSHRSAIEPSRQSVSPARDIEPSSAQSQVHEHPQAEGHSISR